MPAQTNARHQPNEPNSRHQPNRRGFAAALAAFVMWGLFPLYLKPLSGVPALQIMAHRVVWCCLLVFAWLAARRELGAVRAALVNPATRWRLTASALLISVNWLVYVWAVNTGHVVDASLGYFINPLLNVALGVVVLSERLNRAQWAAVALASAGVIYLTVHAGRPPWIALSLAGSFAAYGFIRKVVAVESVPGLATETLLLSPFALAYLVWMAQTGTGAFGNSSTAVDALLIGSGLATALPLTLFAFGARLIPLSAVGLLQYVGPTLQFLIGVLVFREDFPAERAVGFVLIWLALAVYALDTLRRSVGAGSSVRSVGAGSSARSSQSLASSRYTLAPDQTEQAGGPAPRERRPEASGGKIELPAPTERTELPAPTERTELPAPTEPQR